jgi:hypothetical protein
MTVKPEPGPFPEPLNYTFLNEVYGSSLAQKEQNLGTVNVWGRRLPFNKNNNGLSNLQKAVDEIKQLAEKDKDLKNWLNSIQSISTFNNRKIANVDRPSIHSWGIAIDIIPKIKNKVLYWFWVKQYKNEWWDIKETEKAYYPIKVIETMEKYGFTWGGKWYYYDLMHFEYQPEVIIYN